nr:caspase 6, apoptosis-related cysteine peptidase, like 2 isoform X1 [Danio rerio]|eukprot:XP_017210076.1 caspase 6, apoptosis-related cysteine peptidase, like 2 isoform X1 [Danio rerio]
MLFYISFIFVFSVYPNQEYDMKHAKRGLALIFNQKDFSLLGLKTRKGTDKDRDSLVSRFEELDFEVKAYNDYSRDKVLKEIKEVAAADHVDADCFVCIFLSHGEDGHVYANDEKIKIPEITDLFKGDKCRGLVGKPKIFIWQACRGDKKDDPVAPMSAEDSDDEMAVDAGVSNTLPAGADFIMCYSTTEGFCSFRDPLNGTWYIQDLCEIMGRYRSQLEFTNILTLVNRKVSLRSICDDLSATGTKQMPCFASMLTKRLFFRPKK